MLIESCMKQIGGATRPSKKAEDLLDLYATPRELLSNMQPQIKEFLGTQEIFIQHLTPNEYVAIFLHIWSEPQAGLLKTPWQVHQQTLANIDLIQCITQHTGCRILYRQCRRQVMHAKRGLDRRAGYR